MNRRAEVAGDAALKLAQEACFGFDPASRRACNPYIIIERSFDVEAYPVDERQHG